MIAADILIPTRTTDAPAAPVAARGTGVPDFAGVLAASLAVADGAELTAPTPTTAAPTEADPPASAEILAGIALSGVPNPASPQPATMSAAMPAQAAAPQVAPVPTSFPNSPPELNESAGKPAQAEPASPPPTDLAAGPARPQADAREPVAAKVPSDRPDAPALPAPLRLQEAADGPTKAGADPASAEMPQTKATASDAPLPEDGQAAPPRLPQQGPVIPADGAEADVPLTDRAGKTPSRPKQSEASTDEPEAVTDDKLTVPQPVPPQIALPLPATLAQPPQALNAAQGDILSDPATPIDPEATSSRPAAKVARPITTDTKGADPRQPDAPAFPDTTVGPPRPTMGADKPESRPLPASDQADDPAAGSVTAQTTAADLRLPANPQAPARAADTQPIDTGRQGWETALTERITTRQTDLGQEIEITLTPDSIGTVRIKLDLSDKMAAVQIVTDTPQAAQLFQQSETRLAEAFSRAGLTLTSHDAASRDAGGRDGGQRQPSGGQPRTDAALASLRGSFSPSQMARRATNLINIVA